MFVGHYGVAFGARPATPAVRLWVYFIAVQWLDVVWSVLVLLGVEKLHIVPGFTEANPYDLYYMPYTHGLPGAVVLSLALGAVIAAFTAQQRGRAFLIVSAASFSHWILDLIVHIPDLPLYGNTDKVGFGLWRHVAISFPLEIAVLRQILPGDIQLVTPGIRTGKEKADDQKRTLTPKEALDAGADWLVIGRPIYAAQNPRAAAEEILAALT